jgi:hypothetical protein
MHSESELAMTGRLILTLISKLQSSTHPSSQVRKKSKNCEDVAAFLRDDSDDNDFSSSAERSSQISKISCTSGSWPNLPPKRKDSAFQEPDYSKEWMFNCPVAIQYVLLQYNMQLG